MAYGVYGKEMLSDLRNSASFTRKPKTDKFYFYIMGRKKITLEKVDLNKIKLNSSKVHFLRENKR